MSDTSWNVRDYPDPPEERETLCEQCREGIGEDGAWCVEGRWICSACLAEYISEHYTAAELADELGFEHRLLVISD